MVYYLLPSIVLLSSTIIDAMHVQYIYVMPNAVLQDSYYIVTGEAGRPKREIENKQTRGVFPKAGFIT